MHVAHHRRYIEKSNELFTLHRLVFFIFVLLFLTILGSSLALLSQHQQRVNHVYRFEPYPELIPGAPRSAVSRYYCDAQYVPYLDACVINIWQRPIWSISVSLENHRIRRVTYMLRGIILGDLVDRYGRPDYRIATSGKRHNTVTLCWREGIQATAYINGWTSLRSSTTFLAFYDPNQPRISGC